MSAFIVEDRTMNHFLTWFFQQDFRYSVYRDLLDAAQIEEADPERVRKLGITLYQLNTDAVNQRYTEQEQPPLDFDPRNTPASDIQVLKSLSCFLYQCREGNVPETPLYCALERVQASLALSIVQELPAYEKASWG